MLTKCTVVETFQPTKDGGLNQHKHGFQPQQLDKNKYIPFKSVTIYIYVYI